MNLSAAILFPLPERHPGAAAGRIALLCAVLVWAAIPAAAGGGTEDQQAAPLVVEGTQASDVFGLGRSVEVRGTVKHGVVTFGGDIIVTGRVEGDVAAIGGSVFQREGSFIGGDVIVLGGVYHHSPDSPGRRPESTTVMYAGYEEELREMARDPTSFLQPNLSGFYLGQRFLAVLFWIICSLALTAVMPDVISRAAARLELTNLRVAVIGLIGTLMIALGVPVGLRVLPSAMGVLVFLLAALLVVVSYLFGRVAVHATTGRWLQRHLLPEAKRSETTALLLGTVFWVAALSLPYIWPVVVVGLLMVSLGLTLTARYRLAWRHKH